MPAKEWTIARQSRETRTTPDRADGTAADATPDAGSIDAAPLTPDSAPADQLHQARTAEARCVQGGEHDAVVHLAVSGRGEVVMAPRPPVVLDAQGDGQVGDLLDVLLGSQALVIVHVAAVVASAYGR